jgi:hypothetical protein
MKTKLIILILLTTVSFAHANLIGQVNFTGEFTLNHLYDFNNPDAQPFGTFSDQTVTIANGIFSPFIHAGQSVTGQTLWVQGHTPPLFTIGGFDMITALDQIVINGSDLGGRFVGGWSYLTGNGYEFDPNFSLWTFYAPPYDISNFHEDITGPITLKFWAYNDVDNAVPDSGSTLALMGFGLLGLFVVGRKMMLAKLP